MELTPVERLKRAHISIMRDPTFCLYSGVIMLGKASVEPNVPTAYTDGLNVKYGEAFLNTLTDKQIAGLVLHENLHKALRHMTTCLKLWKEDSKLANMAADYVVNQIILDSDKTGRVAELPPQALQDDKYRGWSVLQVFNNLKQEQEQSGGGQNGQPTDDHGFEEGQQLTEEQKREVEKKIDEALRQGEMLSRKMGGSTNRAISDLLTPKVDWRDALREFISSVTAGKDDQSWRNFNRRYVTSDMYLPTTISETVGEIVLAIDTSGSIGVDEIRVFATEVKSICDMVKPERIRILWWDTAVHGEQVFTEESYGQLEGLLKPKGGGGTNCQCVVNYLQQQTYRPECVVVFTDGYLDQVTGFSAPVLWVVTENKDWDPAEGIKVEFNI